MPTDRFYRLPEAKRNTICDAVRKEFARVPFDKASINQIIRNADISRGSFYTYFADKQDALRFILDKNFTRMFSLSEEILESNGGEYINMLKELFEYLVERPQSTNELVSIVKNIFFPEPSAEAMSMLENERENRTDQNLTRKVDTGRFRVQSSDELAALTMMGTGALLSSVMQYYQCPEKLDEVRRLFEAKLDILWHGVYRCQVAEN